MGMWNQPHTPSLDDVPQDHPTLRTCTVPDQEEIRVI